MKAKIGPLLIDNNPPLMVKPHQGMIDYHLHTPFCRHARGTMEEYVQRALEKGIEEICFTPHIPLPDFPRGAANLRMDPEEFDSYLEELESLRSRYRSTTILCGVEADYYRGYEGYLESFLARYPFDLVLLSIHFIRDWPGNNWLFGFDFPSKSLSQIYGEYFRELKRGIATGLFDCLAHLDLIKQPGHPVMESNRNDIEEILDLCSRHGMSIEVNTSGLRKPIGELYPCRRIISLAVGRGLALVTGSDAHDPTAVGYAFSELHCLLEELRGSKIARYRGRILQKETAVQP